MVEDVSWCGSFLVGDWRDDGFQRLIIETEVCHRRCIVFCE